MICIDFGIICIEQHKKSYPSTISNVEFESYKRTEKSKPMYWDTDYYHFKDADKLTGIWYLIWMKEDKINEESFFDIAEKGCPYIYVVPKWKDTVKSLIEFYVQESPINKIAVLVRIQDESNNVTHAVCSINDFMKDLELGNVKWNELYFISKQH